MTNFTELFEDCTSKGRKIKKEDYLQNGRYPIIDQGQEQIAGYSDDEEGLFTEVPAIVFGDHTRIIKYIHEPFFLGADGVKVLRCKNDNANYKYLYYALKNAKIPNTGYNRHFKWLKETKIAYPDITKQDQITLILDKLSKIISYRKQQLDDLDNLIKSRFVEMFGDPVENTMNWQVCRLGDLSVQINSGNTPKGGAQVYVDKGITFFRSQNVWKDRLEMDDIAFIDKETHENMKRSSLKHGDILMTKTGRINTENSSLGRAALYLGQDDEANVNGHVYFIRLKPDINNKFVLKILVSKEYLGYIRSVCVGGIDKRQLNKNHIEDFPIICPPKDMQSKFIDFVQQVDKLKFEVQQSLDESQKLFDSLMQKYFG